MSAKQPTLNERSSVVEGVNAVNALSAKQIILAHDHLRIVGAPILNSPWESDDLGKILFQLSELGNGELGTREQRIASSLIRSAEKLIAESGVLVEQPAPEAEDPDGLERGHLIADIETSIIEIARGELRDYGSLRDELVHSVDKTRGALWNRVAWALEPLHKAADERFWYIASSRIGLYGRPETLDSIGTYLGITRERTRQLESSIHAAIQESVEGEWNHEWMDRATLLCSADSSDFALCFDQAIYFGHDHLGDSDSLFPTIGELLFRHEALVDAEELELWARFKNWLDLDGHPDVLTDAYRRLSRGERRTALVPGAAALERVVQLTREGLRHNGAVDIASIAAAAEVPETALLLALGRDAVITHVPGTSWVAALGDAQGSLRTRIGKLLSNAGPLDAETVAVCLAKARPGRETFATQLPAHVVAAILDLTPGIERERLNSLGLTRWSWVLPPISLGEVSDAILKALRSIPSPFTRSAAYHACAEISKVSVDVFIAGPLVTTLGRDAHQLTGGIYE
jgi:hypothetical protein